MLRRTVDQIFDYSEGVIYPTIFVYDDYSVPSARDIVPDCYYTQFRPRHGKAGYWKIVNRIFEDAKYRQWEYFFMFPDDMTFHPGIFQLAIDSVARVDGERFGCISFNTDQRVHSRQWNGSHPVDDGDLICTQWMDMCFVAKRGFLRALEYRMYQPVRRSESSGVGAAISRKLHRRGLKMYHTKEALVHHGDHRSMMHPEHRVTNPLIH